MPLCPRQYYHFITMIPDILDCLGEEARLVSGFLANGWWFTNLHIGRSNTRVHSFWISLRWPFQSIDILIFITFQSVWQEDLFFFFQCCSNALAMRGQSFASNMESFPVRSLQVHFLTFHSFHMALHKQYTRVKFQPIEQKRCAIFGTVEINNLDIGKYFGKERDVQIAK